MNDAELEKGELVVAVEVDFIANVVEQFGKFPITVSTQFIR
jgi:hypothetical protein